MSDNQKVVNFPKAKTGKGPKTDADLVKDVHRVWRKLTRVIQAARHAGLYVEIDLDQTSPPRITRKF